MSESDSTRRAPRAEKLAQLRGYIDAGEYWRVRAAAAGLKVTYGYHPEVFALEAEAALAMGDLPAAGALHFLCGAEGEAQEQAVEIFRQRCGGDPARMALQAGLFRYWLTLPHERLRKLRDEIGREEWDKLRRRYEERNARKARRKNGARTGSPADSIELKSVPGFAILILALLILAFIGGLTLFVFILEAIKANYR